MVRSGIVGGALLLSFAGVAGRWSQAEETPVPPAAKSVESASNEVGESITQWIEELDAPQFSKRQAAANKLAEAGKAALPALGEAAKSPSREVSERSLDILKRHLQSADEGRKQAARETLEKLARGEHARVARAAQESLKPAPQSLPQNAAPAVPLFPAIRPRIQLGNLQGGNVQARIQVNGGGGGRAIQIQNNNGNKKIQVQDPNRQVTIDEDAGGAIKMEVTETKDGKKETKKYEAKNVAELKQKHPEAHKIYGEFAPLGNNMQIQINALPGMPGLPAVPGARRVPPNQRPNAVPRPDNNPPGIIPPAAPPKP